MAIGIGAAAGGAVRGRIIQSELSLQEQREQNLIAREDILIESGSQLKDQGIIDKRKDTEDIEDRVIKVRDRERLERERKEGEANRKAGIKLKAESLETEGITNDILRKQAEFDIDNFDKTQADAQRVKEMEMSTVELNQSAAKISQQHQQLKLDEFSSMSKERQESFRASHAKEMQENTVAAISSFTTSIEASNLVTALPAVNFLLAASGEKARVAEIVPTKEGLEFRDSEGELIKTKATGDDGILDNDEFNTFLKEKRKAEAEVKRDAFIDPARKALAKSFGELEIDAKELAQGDKDLLKANPISKFLETGKIDLSTIGAKETPANAEQVKALAAGEIQATRESQAEQALQTREDLPINPPKRVIEDNQVTLSSAGKDRRLKAVAGKKKNLSKGNFKDKRKSTIIAAANDLKSNKRGVKNINISVLKDIVATRQIDGDLMEQAVARLENLKIRRGV